MNTAIGRFVGAGPAPPTRPVPRFASATIPNDLSIPATYLQIRLTLDDVHRQMSIWPDQQPALLIESRACNDDLPRFGPDVPFGKVVPYGEPDRDEHNDTAHDRDRCDGFGRRKHERQLTVGYAIEL
jgi:hypothetical protein